MPTCLYAHIVRPEQSKEFGPAAPQTYGLPCWDRALRSASTPLPEPGMSLGLIVLTPSPLASTRSKTCPWTLVTRPSMRSFFFFWPSTIFCTALTRLRAFELARDAARWAVARPLTWAPSVVAMWCSIVDWLIAVSGSPPVAIRIEGSVPPVM